MAENVANQEQPVEGSESTSSVSVDELTKLREQNQRLKGQLTDTEKKYSQFANMYKDIDPDEAKQLKQRLEEAERKAAEKDPAKLEELFDRKFKKYRDEAETEKSSLLQRLQGYEKEIKTLKVTDRVMVEISALFNQDALKFIKREVEEFCDLDEDGTIVVKDENGDPMFRNGKYLGIKDFGEMLAEKYPSLAKPMGSGGGRDATPGQRSQGRGLNKVPQSYAELQAMPNGREVLERLRREDPDAVTKILSTIGGGRGGF